VCSSVLQCVVVCCSVLQCVAVRCSAGTLICRCAMTLRFVVVCSSVLQCVVVCSSVLQCVAVFAARVPSYIGVQWCSSVL